MSMTTAQLFDWAVGIYTQIVQIAMPIAVTFAFGNLIVSSVLRMAFGGRMYFGADRGR